MKTIIAAIAVLVAVSIPAHAQVFGSGLTITGTTNSQPVQTNFAIITLPAKSISLTGITSTNETFIGSFHARIVGTTNLYQLAAITNSFASGTNGGSWSTNTASLVVQVPVEVIMQAAIGANTNQIYVP